MKLTPKDLLAKLVPVLQRVKRYAIFIFMIILFGMFGFLMFRINHYSRVEPTDEAIAEKLQTAKRPRVDQAVIDKIQQLQAQNVDVKSLFDQARNNPFSE